MDIVDEMDRMDEAAVNTLGLDSLRSPLPKGPHTLRVCLGATLSFGNLQFPKPEFPKPAQQDRVALPG